MRVARSKGHAETSKQELLERMNSMMMKNDEWMVSMFASFLLAAAMICNTACGRKEERSRSPAPSGTEPPISGSIVSPARPDEPKKAAPRPPSVEVVDTLDKRCRKRASELAEIFKRGFNFKVYPPFVVAGDLTGRDLADLAKRSVISPAKAMWNTYFKKKPDKVITVLLLDGQKSYRRWSKKLFKEESPPYFGYYLHESRTLVMDIRTGSGTLVHELTHALIDFDFRSVPTWFNEGLASLHEACYIHSSWIEGVKNWRLPILKKALNSNKLRPLRHLLTKRDFNGPLEGLNYAHARYFVMYMQKKKLLVRFYTLFRDTYSESSPNDVEVVEKVFGVPISKVDSDLRAWVKAL